MAGRFPCEDDNWAQTPQALQAQGTARGKCIVQEQKKASSAWLKRASQRREWREKVWLLKLTLAFQIKKKHLHFILAWWEESEFLAQNLIYVLKDGIEKIDFLFLGQDLGGYCRSAIKTC